MPYRLNDQASRLDSKSINRPTNQSFKPICYFNHYSFVQSGPSRYAHELSGVPGFSRLNRTVFRLCVSKVQVAFENQEGYGDQMRSHSMFITKT